MGGGMGGAMGGGMDERTVRVVDGVVVFWAVLWLAIAVWSGFSLWQLSKLGTSVAQSGHALDSAGAALQSLGELPLVGDGPTQLGDEVRATAADVAERGVDARRQLRSLAVLLGLAIFLMPVVPVAGLYLPLRLSRQRDVAALRRALMTEADSAAFDAYLARRAVAHLDYATLREVSPDPGGDLAAGRVRPLADAELRRVGLRRPVGSVAA